MRAAFSSTKIVFLLIAVVAMARLILTLYPPGDETTPTNALRASTAVDNQLNQEHHDAPVKNEGEDSGGKCTACGPEKRDSLPDSWGFKCIGGKCVRTCALWDEGGIWYRAEGVSRMKWMDLLLRAGAPVLEKAHEAKMSASNLEISNVSKMYMPPADAVRMCGTACFGKRKSHKKFSSKYCSCGEFPDQYIEVFPTIDDYTAAYASNDEISFKEGKPFKAVLKEGDSQPRCEISASE